MRFPSLVDAVLSKQVLDPKKVIIGRRTYKDPLAKVRAPKVKITHCVSCGKRLGYELHRTNCPTLTKR